MKNVAFIGTGRMGKPIINNLMKIGFNVDIYARSIIKVYDIISNGARYHSSINDCVRLCDVAITMLGFPKDVEEVYFSTGGLLESVREGTYIIDMTTTSPTLAKLIYEEAVKRKLHFLDAPVTGGVKGAKDAALSIMAGGDADDYNICLPLFRAIGTNINHIGGPGMGQHAKLANQIMIAGTIAGICEAMTYARAERLDMYKFLRSVSTGGASSRQLETAGTKILERDFTPGFSIKHFVKDLLLAVDEAAKENLNLDVLLTVLSHYKQLQDEGYSENGTQTLIKYYGG